MGNTLGSVYYNYIKVAPQKPVIDFWGVRLLLY